MANMGKLILWISDKEGRWWLGEYIHPELDQPRTEGSGWSTRLHPEDEAFCIALAKQIHFWHAQDISFSTAECIPHLIHEALWVWLDASKNEGMSYRFRLNPPLLIYREDDAETVQA